jgi:hypothetical protein
MVRALENPGKLSDQKTAINGALQAPHRTIDIWLWWGGGESAMQHVEKLLEYPHKRLLYTQLALKS